MTLLCCVLYCVTVNNWLDPGSLHGVMIAGPSGTAQASMGHVPYSFATCSCILAQLSIDGLDLPASSVDIIVGCWQAASHARFYMHTHVRHAVDASALAFVDAEKSAKYQRMLEMKGSQQVNAR